MHVPDTAPFSPEQREALNRLLPTLTGAQWQWLLGFAAGVESALRQQAATPGLPATIPVGLEASPRPATPALPGQTVAVPAAAPVAVSKPKKAVPVTIIFGSESGNAAALAQETAREAKQRGLTPTVKDMADCALDNLAKCEHLLVITSTWGDGDPPDNAVELHSAIMGANAPDFSKVKFAVCALGDTSYDKFCQTGKDFDLRLEQLGGQRLSARVDCDVDYESLFRQWLGSVMSSLKIETEPEITVEIPAVPGMPATTATVAPAPVIEPEPVVKYGKSNPFFSPLKEKILLNGRGSEKEVWHLEFSLADSGIVYEPGDSLAVIPRNSPDVVEAVVNAASFVKGNIAIDGGSQISLGSALQRFYDITALTKPVMEKYNVYAESKKIDRLLGDSAALKEYLHGRQIVDFLTDFPVKELSAQEFVGVLRKLPPRLYSIASSLSAHPEEVHLTVAAVRYFSQGRERKGVASTFLADMVSAGDKVPVYTVANKHFKLPADDNTPIIMVGPGTGVAPFRAFIEERQARGAKGRSWLFFGDQRYSLDFMYQLEWQSYLKDGSLTKLEVAFSRDQKQKIYVQHRMLEHAQELWKWLSEGAYFYVCGDANRMAPDVHEALLTLIEKGGGMKREKAEDYLHAMHKEKRYLRDVY